GSEAPRTRLRAVGHRDLVRRLDVCTARSVARFAIDVDAGPRRRIRIGGGLVPLLEARRMARGATRVPIERRRAPVQRISGAYVLVGIKIEPPRPAFIARPRVPRDRQGLETTAADVEEILLKRLDAEDVRHPELAGRAVRPFGADEERAVPHEEARLYAV